jgi:glycosyltransferase involved in cell wall biosynthesis
LIHQKNAGETAARNRGIEEAKTELIAFLDADDEWLPRFLETVLRLKNAYPLAGAYATAYNICLPSGKMIRSTHREVPDHPWEGVLPNYFRAAFNIHPICSSAVAIPKGIFSDLGKFAEGINLGGDLDMWLRIALKYPIAYSTFVSATYYQDADNRACDTYIEGEEPVFIKTALKAIGKNEVASNLMTDFKEYIAVKQIGAAKENIFAGNRHVARRLLLKSKTKRFILRKVFWIFVSALPISAPHWLKKIKKNTKKALKKCLNLFNI